MTRNELVQFFEDTTRNMIETMKRKNQDYCGGRDDEYAFTNFDAVKHIGLCDPAVGILTRMTDKLTRVCGFVKNGSLQVKDESVEDTLQDMAVYCLLLMAMIKHKKTTEKH